jgi:hypothetical protein
MQIAEASDLDNVLKNLKLTDLLGVQEVKKEPLENAMFN